MGDHSSTINFIILYNDFNSSMDQRCYLHFTGEEIEALGYVNQRIFFLVIVHSSYYYVCLGYVFNQIIKLCLQHYKIQHLNIAIA